jgi:PAS domain S-box-containing protein
MDQKNKNNVNLTKVERMANKRQNIPHEYEEKYSGIFKSAPFGLLSIDLRGRILSCNEAFYRISGYTSQDFAGKHFTQIPTLHKKDFSQFRQILKNFIRGKFSSPIEFPWIHRDGSKRLAEAYVTSIKVNKKITGIQCLVLDITEKKKAEEALRESEEKFRSIIDSSPMGMHMYELKNDGNLVFTGANPAADKILGMDNSQFIGKTIEEAFPLLAKTEVPKRYRLAAEKGIPWQTEQIDYQDEKIRGAFEVYAFQTSPRHMVAMFLDITERKQMDVALKMEKNLLDSIAQTSPAGIIVLDKNGHLLFVNKRSEEISGLSGSKLKDLHDALLWNISDFEGHPFPENKLPFNLIQRTKKPVYGVKQAVELQKGKRIYLSVNAAPLFTSNGDFDGMVGVIEDVSEQIRSEKALRESEEKYRKTVELSPDAIALIDLKGVVTDCNSALVRLTGASKEELAQKHFTKIPFLFKKDIPRYLRIFASLLKGKVPKPFEVQWIHKNGQIRDGEILLSLMKREGQLTGVQVITRDITERKHIQDQLKIRAEFERLILITSTKLINISPNEFDKAINETLKQIGKFSQVDRGYIFLFSEDDRAMDNTHEWCAKGIVSQIDRLKGLPTEYFSWSLSQMRRGEILHIPRVNDLPPEALPERKEFEKERIQSVICVPIVNNKKMVGFIGFDSVKDEKVWSEDSIMLLRLIADVLSNAIDRFQKESELRLSERKFRTLAENSPNMIFINRMGKVIFANKECERIVGYSQEEFKSPDFDFLSLIAPESVETVKSNFAKHMKGQDVPPYEYILVTKEGRHIQVINSSKLISYEGEMSILGVVMDITSRKRGEIARAVTFQIAERAREVEKLEDLYREIHQAIIEVMPAKKNFYIALYDESLDMLEFPYFLDEFEDNPGPQKLEQGLTEYVLRSGRPLLASPEKFERLEAQGEVVSVGPPSVDWLGVPLKVKNRTIGVMVTQTYTKGVRFSEDDKELLMLVSEQIAGAIERKRADNTLQESEKKYRELYEGSRDALGAIDMNGKFIEFNSSFQEMIGYAPEEIYKLKYEDITPKKWHAMEKNILDTQVKRRGYSDIYEKEYLRKDGTVFPVELRAYLTKVGDGQPTRMWAIVRDISERKKIEREILDSQERLRSLTAHLQSVREQERTNIAREIHDEMGQTLTALKMDLSWIKKRMGHQPEPIGEKISGMSVLIDGAVRSMKRISTELRPGLLDDFGLSAAMEWQAEEFTIRTGIECHTVFKPKEIVVDKDRTTAVFRIFQEALTNVARHSQATGVKVELIKSQKFIKLTIKDNGKGIAKEKISGSESFGLMGMRERVTFMGGGISIEGVNGKGTVITARIPL